MADQPRSPFPDPTEWKTQFDEAVRQWNDFLSNMMGSEAYAAASSRYMDAFLDFQGMLGQNVERYLQSINVPTRSDFLALAERIAAVEARIEELSTKIDSLGEETAPANAG